MHADPEDTPSAGGGRTPFVGRAPVLARVRQALGQVRGGDPALVVVEGPAGIGKTALVNHVLADIDVPLVLTASGEDAETTLMFGVLDQLVGAAPAGLAARLAQVLHGGEHVVDPLVAGAALLDLLGELQSTSPVVVVVEDAHWADRASLQALTFALRRLRADRVMTLITTRDVADSHLPDGLRRLLTADQAVHIQLAGLSPEELRALSGLLSTQPLSPRAAARLHAHTDGNPLYARALLKQVPAPVFDDADAPLPAPRSFAKLVLAELAACTPDAQRLVVAASVLGVRCPLHQAARVADLDDPMPALEQAINADLLVEQPAEPMVRFPHPLIRASIYQHLGPARRAALHNRVATLGEDEIDDVVRLRHRVRAARGPNADLAAELARLGRQQARLSAWATAADHLSNAARLCPVAAEGEQLALEAAECLLLAGDIRDPDGMTARLRACRESAWRSYVLGRLAFVAGNIDEAEALFNDAWQRRETDVALSARVAGQLAALHSTMLHGAESAEWATRALQLAPDQVATDLIHFLPIQGLAWTGHAEDAQATVTELPEPATASVTELDLLLGRGLLELWTDDLTGARRDLTGVLTAGHDRSAGFRIVAAVTLGQVEFRAGRWDDAIGHCDLAESIATDTDHIWLALFCHAMAVSVPAARGLLDDAERHARPLRAAAASGYISPLLWAAWADAYLAHARGDPEAVVAALEPVVRDTFHLLEEPGVFWWMYPVLDALVALDDPGRAEAILGPFEARATRRGRRSAMAAAARVRGGLEAARGDHARADASFRAGLRHSDGLGMPFDRALLELAYGTFLRHTGKRGAAVPLLRSAHDVLARLDARGDLERCRHELLACGLTPGGHRERISALLTPRELAVAQAVVTGLTNSDVARKLFISVKTVEFHLGNIYAKLQVSSRVQLTRKLAEDY